MSEIQTNFKNSKHIFFFVLLIATQSKHVPFHFYKRIKIVYFNTNYSGKMLTWDLIIALHTRKPNFLESNIKLSVTRFKRPLKVFVLNHLADFLMNKKMRDDFPKR